MAVKSCFIDAIFFFHTNTHAQTNKQKRARTYRLTSTPTRCATWNRRRAAPTRTNIDSPRFDSTSIACVKPNSDTRALTRAPASSWWTGCPTENKEEKSFVCLFFLFYSRFSSFFPDQIAHTRTHARKHTHAAYFCLISLSLLLCALC